MTDGFERPPTSQEAVLVALRQAIVRGELRPGEQVRQEALADRFGVSRVPLREALKILEGEGSVSYVPHRGYFVAELSLSDLLEVYRIRRLLEAEAVRAGLPRLTEADVTAFADAVDDCERAGRDGDLVAMTDANRALHFALVGAAGLPRLERMIRILWDATDVYRSVYYADSGNRAVVEAEHREILAAVRARDVERVVSLLDEHRDHAVAHIRTLVPTPSNPGPPPGPR
ncbi:MAG TPA: GntR family transcriptional regulator [Actinomycetes bacterium]